MTLVDVDATSSSSSSVVVVVAHCRTVESNGVLGVGPPDVRTLGDIRTLGGIRTYGAYHHKKQIPSSWSLTRTFLSRALRPRATPHSTTMLRRFATRATARSGISVRRNVRSFIFYRARVYSRAERR